MKPFPTYSYITNSYGFLKSKKYLVDEIANTNILKAIVHRWKYDYEDEQWHMRPDTRTNYTSYVGVMLYGITVGTTAEGFNGGDGRLVFPTRFDWNVVHTGEVSRIKEATLYAQTDVDINYRGPHGDMTNVYGTCVARVGTATEVSEP